MAKASTLKSCTYKYASPVIGLHVDSSPKLEDITVANASFKPQPYQKNLAKFTDLNAIAKSIKHDCYSKTGKSLTKDCYSLSPKELSQHLKPTEQRYGFHDPPINTTKKIAQTYKFFSSVFSPPEKHFLKDAHTTSHQDHFVPISVEKPLLAPQLSIYKQTTCPSDPNAKSEYNSRFNADQKGVELVRLVDSAGIDTGHHHEAVRGRAKLNLTHNIITGS